jgi:hypothetical protein
MMGLSTDQYPNNHQGGALGNVDLENQGYALFLFTQKILRHLMVPLKERLTYL